MIARARRKRPQLQPQVRIVGDEPLGVVGDVDRGEGRVGGGGRDRLADAGNVQDLGLADAVDRQVGLADPARRRARAHVGELVAVLAMGDEIKPGMSAAVDHDPARVDAFLEPKLGQRLAETVGADGGEIGGVRAKPRRSDHRVRSVAAESLHEGRAVLRLIEFDQRFADRQKIRHTYLVATRPRLRPSGRRWGDLAPHRAGRNSAAHRRQRAERERDDHDSATQDTAIAVSARDRRQRHEKRRHHRMPGVGDRGTRATVAGRTHALRATRIARRERAGALAARSRPRR